MLCVSQPKWGAIDGYQLRKSPLVQDSSPPRGSDSHLPREIATSADFPPDCTYCSPVGADCLAVNRYGFSLERSRLTTSRAVGHALTSHKNLRLSASLLTERPPLANRNSHKFSSAPNDQGTCRDRSSFLLAQAML